MNSLENKEIDSAVNLYAQIRQLTNLLNSKVDLFSEEDKKLYDNSVKLLDREYNKEKYDKLEDLFLENKRNEETMELECPHCHSTSIKKNGTKKGVQRYLCKSCNKTFAGSLNTILFSS